MSGGTKTASSARTKYAPSEASSYETDRTSASLPRLQDKGAADEHILEPLNEEEIEPGSYDLVRDDEEPVKRYSLEERSELLFSTEHLKVIFSDPSLLLRFTSFLSHNRPNSVPMLIYYLDALKALKAIRYANSITGSLDAIEGHDFTNETAPPAANRVLEQKARDAFQVLVRDDLPAYITHLYIQTVSISITMRITGTLPAHLRQASEGLAEVFCLTDPSRSDNPIVFASEEFHRTTQYGMNYVIGRNCRFLQGPHTNQASVKRFSAAVAEGKDACEVFLNYRRDGSPFMNLLQFAPLRDSRGTIRYFIGAQVDVSGLVKECSDLESLRRLVIAKDNGKDVDPDELDLTPIEAVERKNDCQELAEMMNLQELETVRLWGGRMHRDHQPVSEDQGRDGNWNKQRILIQDRNSELSQPKRVKSLAQMNGSLTGVYQHYLLVRPYPSLKILFASPTMRVPGILQSSFLSKIGGSPRVREELTQALADGRGVTAKIRWITKHDQDGRSRWIHCTSLVGSNGNIGVWMVVLVDDEKEGINKRLTGASC
jgi:PAS domain S-box-containing protein